MASVFDQYNQAKMGPENDYSQALGLVSPKASQTPQWANYGGSGSSDSTNKALKGANDYLFGADKEATAFADSQQVTPEQAAAENASKAQGQISPQGAIGMLGGQQSKQPQWSNFDSGGGGGGGGGMDMSSIASIAGAFI